MWTFLFCLPIVAGMAPDFNPCKRQSFRATCVSDKSKGLRRSQFVLRYYQRGNDCVSYPYGRCPGDPVGDQLFRYKKECEDYCLRQQNRTEAVRRTTSQTTTLPYWTQIERDEFTTKSSTITLGNSVFDPNKWQPRNHSAVTFPPPVVSRNDRKTKCQLAHDQAESTSASYIPLCTLSGEYMPVQCDNGTRFCWCVNNQGHELPRTRTGRFPPRCKSSKLWWATGVQAAVLRERFGWEWD